MRKTDSPIRLYKNIEAHTKVPLPLREEIRRILSIANEAGISCDDSMVCTQGEDGLLLCFPPHQEPAKASLQLSWSPMPYKQGLTMCAILLRCGEHRNTDPDHAASIKIFADDTDIHHRIASLTGKDDALQQCLGLPSSHCISKQIYYWQYADYRFESHAEYIKTLRTLFHVYQEQPEQLFR